MKSLSFIIITYNRPAEMLALLRNIVQLDRASELLEEVIIVNNASSEDYSDVRHFISKAALPIIYIVAPENLGVAKGRNFALAKGSAPIIIMLDDDAELQNRDCLANLVREFETENTENPKAVISFKVLYHSTLKMQVNAFPHKRFNEYKAKSFFETYYYAGGAHAIKRRVIEELGGYPDDFFYGMEEYDLSYRILDAGYSIVYSDTIVMLHKESPYGRKPQREKLQMMWVNKSKVAWKYLPKKYFYSTAFMWSIQYLIVTRLHLVGFFSGWKKTMKIPSTEKRSTISEMTLTYLKKVKARLWY